MFRVQKKHGGYLNYHSNGSSIAIENLVHKRWYYPIPQGYELEKRIKEFFRKSGLIPWGLNWEYNLIEVSR